MKAVEYLLTLADWQWFGTLTWRDSDMGSIRKRASDVDEFLRERFLDGRDRWATHERDTLTDAPLVIRWERGEQNERPHCHFLLDGFPPHKVNKNEGHKWNAIWHRHHGLARVRPYESTLRVEVASYLSPELDTELLMPSSRHEANRYERGKFDRADSLIINDAAWNRWQAITATEFNVAPCT